MNLTDFSTKSLQGIPLVRTFFFVMSRGNSFFSLLSSSCISFSYELSFIHVGHHVCTLLHCHPCGPHPSSYFFELVLMRWGLHFGVIRLFLFLKWKNYATFFLIFYSVFLWHSNVHAMVTHAMTVYLYMTGQIFFLHQTMVFIFFWKETRKFYWREKNKYSTGYKWLVT